MARGYNAAVRQDQTPAANERPEIPLLWLLSDARNDAALERALAKLPRGSGFIFRHYHLEPLDRQKRFQILMSAAKKRDHCVILSDSPVKAHQWGADGIYGTAARMPKDDSLMKLVAAHNWKEIVAADRAGAHAIFLSPVFSTRSHSDAKPLGPVRFRMLANKASAPIIALGGMTKENAKRLNWPRWGAIDGLS